MAAQQYLLGVDGGGTTCRARLTDRDGTVLGQGLAGPCNIRLGAGVAWAEIHRACAAAFAEAGVPQTAQAQTVAVFGLAGAAQAAHLNAFLGQPHPFAALDVTGDAVIACLGAFGGADGAILITGTGSAGFGLVNGRQITAGGWGFEVSDHGSGAWIGRRALELAVLGWDGLADAGALGPAVLARFGSSPFGVVDWAGTARPADYAALVPVVLEQAAAGDPVAVALLTEAAGHAARVLRRLRDQGAPRLALVGGLAGVLAAHLPPQERGWLTDPQGDALSGALILAKQSLAKQSLGHRQEETR